MSRSALRSLVLAALLAFASTAAGAQQRARASFSLVVVEAGSNRPVPDVRVQISGVRGTALTDAQGRARLPGVPAGRRLVSITRIGYQEERAAVEFGTDDVEADLELRPQPVTLAGVRVRSEGRVEKLRSTGFYQRQRRGQGAFLDRDQIERRRATQMIDVFRQVRGFQVSYTPAGKLKLVTSRGSCGASPLIFLDGVEMHDVEKRGDPSDYVNPEQVEAIEAYAGLGAIPAEYNPTGSACGVILIWTRSGR